MELLACRRCHVSAGRGNSLAASLDGAAMRKSAGELALSIRLPVANMPNFSLDEARITTLVNIIVAGSLGRATDHTAPVKVHYKDSAKKNLDIFSKKCGGCHRIVSERRGAIGTSDIGPNLSGLFSKYFPRTFKSGEIWNVQNLRTWLKNPRETRPWARMQPVELAENEMNELESIIIISETLINLQKTRKLSE
jgi:cytochrome c2